MSYFKEQQLKKLTLPSNPDYYVEVLESLTWSAGKELLPLTPGSESTLASTSDAYLNAVVKAWNLDDETGTVLPITPENLNRLSREDAMFIIANGGGEVQSEEQKKSSPLKSTHTSVATASKQSR